MNTPSSRPPDERFAEWVDDCMSPRDRERFEAELRVNATLRAELVAYERTVATLREALQAPTAQSALAGRVLAAVQAARTLTPTPSGQRPRRSLGAYLFGGLAAAALMAVAMWFDAWVTPTGQVDKVAQVDPTAVGTPPAVAAPDEAIAGTGEAADVPAAEQGTENGLATGAAKKAAGEPEGVERKKPEDLARDDVSEREKSQGADAKGKGGFGSSGEPGPTTSGGLPEKPAVPEPAERELVDREVVPTAPPPAAPAAPVAPPLPVPGGAVRAVPEPGEGASRARDTAKPDAGRTDALGEALDKSGVGSTESGAPDGSRVAPPSTERAPLVGSPGVPSPTRAPASPFAEPLPWLTVERGVPAPTEPPPSAGGGLESDAMRARFAEAAPMDLPRLVDTFLATAGAGAGDEIVWRTARGSVVLRAVDPVLLAQPGERDARRTDPTATGGGGGATAVPLPAPRAWLIVGEPADIEVLLARLGAKVRAEGWRLQTGEFEGPKAQQGQKPQDQKPQDQKPQNPGGPATRPAGAQRSLLLQFRFVR